MHILRNLGLISKTNTLGNEVQLLVGAKIIDYPRVVAYGDWLT